MRVPPFLLLQMGRIMPHRWATVHESRLALEEAPQGAFDWPPTSTGQPLVTSRALSPTTSRGCLPLTIPPQILCSPPGLSVTRRQALTAGDLRCSDTLRRCRRLLPMFHAGRHCLEMQQSYASWLHVYNGMDHRSFSPVDAVVRQVNIFVIRHVL